MSLLAVCYQQLFFISALFHFCLLSTPALDHKVDFQVNGKSRLVSTDSFSLLLLYVLGSSTCRPSWLVKRAEQCAVFLLWCCEVDCELNTRAGNVTGKGKKCGTYHQIFLNRSCYLVSDRLQCHVPFVG